MHQLYAFAHAAAVASTAAAAASILVEFLQAQQQLSARLA
jgi:hypothetical protein